MAFRLEHRVPPPLVGVITAGLMYAISRVLPLFAFDLPHRQVLAAATATYQMALARGHGKLDKGAMIKVYEELLGVEFRAR